MIVNGWSVGYMKAVRSSPLFGLSLILDFYTIRKGYW